MLWSMRLRSSVRLIAFATGCRLGRMRGNSGTSIACCSAATPTRKRCGWSPRQSSEAEYLFREALAQEKASQWRRFTLWKTDASGLGRILLGDGRSPRWGHPRPRQAKPYAHARPLRPEKRPFGHDHAIHRDVPEAGIRLSSLAQ